MNKTEIPALIELSLLSNGGGCGGGAVTRQQIEDISEIRSVLCDKYQEGKFVCFLCLCLYSCLQIGSSVPFF